MVSTVMSMTGQYAKRAELLQARSFQVAEGDGYSEEREMQELSLLLTLAGTRASFQRSEVTTIDEITHAIDAGRKVLILLPPGTMGNGHITHVVKRWNRNTKDINKRGFVDEKNQEFISDEQLQRALLKNSTLTIIGYSLRN